MDYREKAIEMAWYVMAQADITGGVYDTMALSHIRDAAEFLVSEGLLKNTGNGFGRRQFYERIEN